jgi:hypothetical protein
MQARELFGVFVRTGGLVFVVFSFFDLLHFVTQLVGLTHPTLMSRLAVGLAAAFYFVVGVATICGAQRIVRLVYGRERNAV